jgi:hypothetical protein
MTSSPGSSVAVSALPMICFAPFAHVMLARRKIQYVLPSESLDDGLLEFGGSIRRRIAGRANRLDSPDLYDNI